MKFHVVVVSMISPRRYIKTIRCCRAVIELAADIISYDREMDGE